MRLLLDTHALSWWDRIMMAHAVAEECRMVTIDRVFSDYGIPVLW